ncbi:MAG TPA: hypothetical protein VKE74_27395 [Gemmataceae bacterium]|nr:hypothetical protein [Gemmataceae bacterium]
MTDDEFLAAFEAAAIARTDWTHEAHVRMAWLYLTRLPFVAALEKVRAGIRKLNAAFAAAANPQCKPAETENPPGYHDTITVAFVRVIASRLAPGEDYAAFRDRHPDLFDRTLPALLHYYSKKRLSSAKARQAFVEPDREELPAVGLWDGVVGCGRRGQRPRAAARG